MSSTALLFESKLVTFCSPTLLKMKAGNIFNISNEFNELEECLNYYNQLCNQRGIYISIIHENNNSKMIYVYQKEKLNNLFNNHKFRAVLNNYHYPYQDIDSLINWLKIRMNSSEFPHEIGLFLGYPLTDVKGFINGADYKYIGYWKVYSHVPQTLCTFDRYKKCTQELKRRFCQGERIEQLLAHV